MDLKENKSANWNRDRLIRNRETAQAFLHCSQVHELYEFRSNYVIITFN
jgi:hypothetical protein